MDKRKLLGAHLVHHVPAAVVATDTEGKILYWNRGAEQLYGWRSSETVGKNIVELFVPEEERQASTLKESLEAGQWEGQQWRLRKDGSRVLAHVAVTPIFDASGKQVARIGVSIGITRQADQRNGIGRRIAESRREAGLTQKELARLLRVSVRSVQGYEAGSVTPYRRLADIARAVNREVSWLLRGR
jgi:PAS domain S-box-containing protein